MKKLNERPMRATDLYPSFQSIIFTIILLFNDSVAFSQRRTVTGMVTGEDGSGIPGVNVVAKGTTIGTVTNTEGKYNLDVNSGSEFILVFSFVGYKTEEVPVNHQTSIDVRLLADLFQLEEIIVTGYSTIEKKDLSSSIAAVDVNEIQKYASSNFGEQLLGKTPGVQVNTTSDPGSFQSIRIRGIGSINNNEPLYVIDGVPIQNEANMNFLNPADIESMQVLKDAAAASIYGARAANGVVVITTRKGKGQPKLNVDFYSGTQIINKTQEVANPSEVLEIEKGLADGAGQPFNSTFYIKDGNGNWTLPDYYVFSKGYAATDPAVDPSRYYLNTYPTGDYSKNYPITQANKEGTDWFEEMFRPATLTNLQVSASGGDEKSNFYLSVNYFDQEGILIRNYYKRIQTRLNGTYSITKNILIGENLNLAYETRNGTLGSALNISDIFGAAQITPVRDIDGYWAANNLVARQNRAADGTKANTWRLTGNVFGEISFLKNFTFKTNFGLDNNSGPQETYTYSCPECAPPNNSIPNNLKLSWFDSWSWVWSNVLHYNKTFGEHSISALVGSEARHSFSQGGFSQGSRLEYGDDPNYRTIPNTDPKSYVVDSYKSESKMSSVFLNANYNFNDKYFLTATVRRDGSSRFIHHKYGTFPAASLAWRISEESFMKSIKLLTNLKLRASYGATGNNEVLGGDYPGYTKYATSKDGSSYDINGTGNSIVSGFAKTSVGNPDLKWETSIIANVGIDATLWRSLDLTVEWFQRRTEDMIYPVQLSLQSGDFYQNQNIGSMENKGLEVQLNYKGNAISNSLHYSVGISGTHYKNKVLNLDANDNTFVLAAGGRIGGIARTEAGRPISQFYGYVSEGLWQSQEQINEELYMDVGGAKPGRMKFRDLNEDGKINQDDKTFIGSPIPKFLLGFNLSLAYKNFDLTAYFNGVYGRKIFNYLYYNTDFNSPFLAASPSKRMLYEAGKSLPVLDITDSYSSESSTYYVSDGSYTRLRNLVIGYSLPRALTNKVGLQKVRIYIQAQNLFTLTSYQGTDPEGSIIDIQNGNQPQRDFVTGVDNWGLGRYPAARQFIAGINFEF